MTRVARAARWAGQLLCGLRTGHYYLRAADPTRVVLVCLHCGHESPGWSLPTTEDR